MFRGVGQYATRNRTAQFGLHYGVTNTTGQMDKDKAIQILEAAISKGTFDIDTSPSYGKAEKVIGEVPKEIN